MFFQAVTGVFCLYGDCMETNVIEMIGITKTFPGVVANDNITLTVRENEVLALLGENGAG